MTADGTGSGDQASTSARPTRIARSPLQFFGEALDRVRDADVTRLLVRLRRAGRVPKTIRNILSILHSVFVLAMRRR